MIADHEFTTDFYGKTLHSAPEYDSDIENSIRPFFDDYYSIRFDNYAVSDHYLHDHEFIPMQKS